MFKRVSGTLSGHVLLRLLVCCLFCEQSLVNCARNDLGALVSDADHAFSEVIMLAAFLKLLSVFRSVFSLICLIVKNCESPQYHQRRQAERTCQTGDQFDTVIACRGVAFKTSFFQQKQLAADLEHLFEFRKPFVY